MSTIALDHVPRGGTAPGFLILAAFAFFVYRQYSPMLQSHLLALRVNCLQAIKRIFVVVHDFRSGKLYNPWSASTPTILVTEKKHIAEFSEVTCLSQQAAYADMFRFKHTMANFEHDRIDHKVVRNRFNNRLLEVKGPAHLEALYPNFLARFEDAWTKALDAGRHVEGGTSLPAALTCRKLSTRMISLIFFGQKLTLDERFINNLLQYSADMVNCMIAFQVIPEFLSPYVHWIITRGGKAMDELTKQFTNTLDLKRGAWDEDDQIKRCTIAHNMATLSETSDYWTGPAMCAQNMLGLWFAASHQPWMNMNFILLELCARRDWQQAIREEIEAHAPLDEYKKLEELPILDSFMKETVRLTPLDTMGIRRKAVLPYKLSDGSVSVPQGATICVPAYEMMHDAARYPNPHTFDGARFLPKEGREQRKFTQVAHDFPMWGYGSLACPGRFHASLVIKIVVSQLISRYDMSLENEKAPKKWSWETFAMPYESTQMILRERGTV